MTVELSYAEYGAGPPLVILHGLFGSARNWTSLARHLGETHHVYALDLRNHGASGWAETMTYQEMAGDVGAFLARHGLEGATVMGHSMGGKTAMRLALDGGSVIGRLIVVDIAPVAYDHTHAPLIAAMQNADLTAATRRSEVDRQLEAQIPEASLRSFLLQNLTTEDGRLRWRINLDALAANMAVLTGYPDDLEGRRFDSPAFFLAGAESDYVLPQHHGAILTFFPQAEIDAIEGAGHWVHAEQPRAFLERVQTFLT